MAKILVAYFSPTGTTRRIANDISDILGAEIYEIKPAILYDNKDLDWDKKDSRSSVEMMDQNSRPELADKNANISAYDTIFVGFPIWWYVAPHIINTFLESYDFGGKTIVTFATSGGSGFGDALSNLKHSAPDAKFIEGRVFHGRTEKDTVATWIKTVDF
jgi:flavodoxin